MYLFLSSSRSAFDPTLVGDPVCLRRPVLKDYRAWVGLRQESRAHLTKWEQNWTDKDITLAKYRQRLRFFERTARSASGLSLFIFRQEDQTLVGGLTMTNIRYGAAQTGTLGYWIGEPYLRQGFARAAIDALLPYIFEVLTLNRIEAACQSGNVASIRLLEAIGFAHEGRAADYLKINGNWRDHELFGLTASAYRSCLSVISSDVDSKPCG